MRGYNIKKKKEDPIQYSDYILDIDYQRVRADDCDERCANDYCRCSTIQDIHIKSVDMKLLLNTFVDYLNIDKNNEIIVYCIDRILRHHDLYEPEQWEVKTCGGYYGEEIDGIQLDSKTEGTVMTDIKQMLQCKSNEVEYVLYLEYGNVLEQLLGKTWEVQEVCREDIILGNREYMRKLFKEKCYKDYDGIVAVCTKDGEGYRLWDGYHRYAASKGNPRVKILLGA